MTPNGTFHQQLAEKLRSLLRGGEYPPGAKFLTEREIADRFNTSRPTANKALSSLVSAGLLDVRRGAGTFVREGVLDYDLERLVSFTDKALAAGRKPGTQLIAFRHLNSAEVPSGMREPLRTGPKESLIYMERLRLADGVPVIFERRHVVAKLCPKMTRKDASGSLYRCWTEKFGLEITGADETIHAVNVAGDAAAHLQVAPGTACFKIVATGFVGDAAPLWHEETFYRADVYEFRNRISGLSGAHAALGKIRA